MGDITRAIDVIKSISPDGVLTINHLVEAFAAARDEERKRTIEDCAKAIEADKERVDGSEGMMLGESCIYDVCAITVRALLKGGAT